MVEPAQSPRERRAERRKAIESESQRRRRRAQEDENGRMLERGSRLLGESERALRRALGCFQNIRVPRGTPERREFAFLQRQLSDALTSLRRAKRGSLIDFSDPDLAMEDPDLES